MMGVIPYAGVSFFTYETLKRWYRGMFMIIKITNSMAVLKFDVLEHVDSSPTPHPIASLGFGAIAGMLGQSTSYPLDIVRRRMQTDTNKTYLSILGTLRTIHK